MTPPVKNPSLKRDVTLDLVKQAENSKVPDDIGGLTQEDKQVKVKDSDGDGKITDKDHFVRRGKKLTGPEAAAYLSGVCRATTRQNTPFAETDNATQIRKANHGKINFRNGGNQEALYLPASESESKPEMVMFSAGGYESDLNACNDNQGPVLVEGVGKNKVKMTFTDAFGPQSVDVDYKERTVTPSDSK